MNRDRLKATDRQVRRNTRRLKRVLRHVPEHKQLIAEQLIGIAMHDDDTSSLGALETLLKLVESKEVSEELDRTPGLTQAIRDLGDTPPSTPMGHPVGTKKPNHIYIDSPQPQYAINERLLSKPSVIASRSAFVESVYIHFFRHRSFSLPFEFPWKSLSSSDKRKYSTALTDLYKEITGAWPTSLPVREPELGVGDVVCPACNGTRSVPRSLRVALEWFLARRAKKAKLDGRDRIDPGDWGYEEIAAVELCDYYRNMQTPLVALDLEVGVPNLFQDQKPTRLHPTSIEIHRYPTAAQLKRGSLELKEKYKKMTATDRTTLRKVRKEGRVRGPTLIDNKKGVWVCDWKQRGVGCRVTHISSSITVSSESYSNFGQNLSLAELELESKVASWFEEQKNVPCETITGTQKDDLRN